MWSQILFRGHGGQGGLEQVGDCTAGSPKTRGDFTCLVTKGIVGFFCFVFPESKKKKKYFWKIPKNPLVEL